MPKKQLPAEENFFFKTAKDFIPEMLKYVLGAVIAFVVLRTDVTALTKRVDAVESGHISRDVALEKFDSVNQRLDELGKKLHIIINLHLKEK